MTEQVGSEQKQSNADVMSWGDFVASMPRGRVVGVSDIFSRWGPGGELEEGRVAAFAAFMSGGMAKEEEAYLRALIHPGDPTLLGAIVNQVRLSARQVRALQQEVEQLSGALMLYMANPVGANVGHPPQSKPLEVK